MVWRDHWDGTPRVVVITEHEEDGAALDATVLLVRFDGPPPATVDVTSERGRALRLHLPRDLTPFTLAPRQTLTVEVIT